MMPEKDGDCLSKENACMALFFPYSKNPHDSSVSLASKSFQNSGQNKMKNVQL